MRQAVTRMRGGTVFSTATAALATVAVLFFVVPLIALVTRVSPLDAASLLAEPETRTAIRVSVVSVVGSIALVVLFGTPVAYLLARRAPTGRLATALNVVFDLPLVLPPAVAGIALLATFGANGPFAEPLAAASIQIPFTRFAVVLALVFVAGPLYIRQAQAAFAAINPAIVDAARLSGRGQTHSFFAIDLALARRGLVAGGALASARALGEFGATIMFAGSVAGVTETITLAIYGSLDSDMPTGFALATLLLAITIVMSAAGHLVARRAPEGNA